jgi:predicted RNA-binding protein with PUA-like domain
VPKRWLVKTEPSEYSFDDLVREGETVWTGIKNALALRNLRAMKAGDEVLVYHTGKEKAVVGVARAGPGTTLVPFRRLPRPVPLAALKAEPSLAEWDLVRFSRLSVMPVPAVAWRKVLALSAVARR